MVARSLLELLCHLFERVPLDPHFVRREAGSPSVVRLPLFSAAAAAAVHRFNRRSLATLVAYSQAVAQLAREGSEGVEGECLPFSNCRAPRGSDVGAGFVSGWANLALPGLGDASEVVFEDTDATGEVEAGEAHDRETAESDAPPLEMARVLSAVDAWDEGSSFAGEEEEDEDLGAWDDESDEEEEKVEESPAPSEPDMRSEGVEAVEGPRSGGMSLAGYSSPSELLRSYRPLPEPLLPITAESFPWLEQHQGLNSYALDFYRHGSVQVSQYACLLSAFYLSPVCLSLSPLCPLSAFFLHIPSPLLSSYIPIPHSN
jgi:hypothetical protein